jgi:CDP-glycerol glycerophosphotransferase (TagB/SpsB family)
MGADYYTENSELHLERISLRKEKSPIIVYFGRPGSFSDNSKYLYLDACANPYGMEPFWATADQRVANLLESSGLPVLPLMGHIDPALRVLVKAAAVVFCVNPNEAMLDPRVRAAVTGAFKLQLWHGLFANKLDLQLTDDANLTDRQMSYQLFGAAEVDAVLAPSAQHDRNFSAAFGAPCLIRAGYPRNEVILREPTLPEQLGAIADQDLAAAAPGRRILFCPTFSKLDQPLWLEAWFLKLLQEIHEVLGVTTFIKPHPFEAKIARTFTSIAPGVHVIPAVADIYPSLRMFDLMISDYSSLMDDFHLTGKPILILQSPERARLREGYLFGELHQERLAGVVEPANLLETIRRALDGDFAGKGSASDYSTPQLGSCAQINTFLAGIVAEQCAKRPELIDLTQ